MKCDFHIHSLHSGDGQASIYEMCRAAASKGFSAVCFTEHHDLGLFSQETQAYIEKNMPGFAPFRIEDPKAYQREVIKAREDFPELEVLLGVELGAASLMDEGGLDIIELLPLDYLLISCHDAGGIDPYLRLCYEGRERVQVIEAYLKSMHDGMLAAQSFDGLAHIGYVYRYIKRYGLYGEDGWRYNAGDCPEILDAVLKMVIEKGAALEVNMSGWGEGYSMPDIAVLKRYVHLGGEAAIYASDAHRPEDIGRYYREALEIMKASGVKYLAEYRQRKKTFTKI
ncbi:MAG: histidinol-phosphatase HisJ family protein [Christensenellales bacterium]|jgi:histidinol-phosphatase (PHP family)